ncbi:MAG TPA: hypothetical protein VM282_23595 [Acidimicrobiales bacterium]|nr:hypothetical protein [Acidimicrobiales bacterium]
MRQSHRGARFGHLCDVAGAIGLAAAIARSAVGCASSDDTRGQLGDRLRRAASASKDGIPRYVRATLIDLFEGTGMTNEQATCVADRTLEDDKILTPLLVNLVFGDPGVGTAVFVATRATRGCLSAADLARLFPGR